jgi:hypothetical protein
MSRGEAGGHALDIDELTRVVANVDLLLADHLGQHSVAAVVRRGELALLHHRQTLQVKSLEVV